MYAEIKSLTGKYYGTEVVIHTKNGDCIVTVWHMGDFKPSRRELEKLDQEEEFEAFDSHYETKDGFEIAQKIQEAFNESR